MANKTLLDDFLEGVWLKSRQDLIQRQAREGNFVVYMSKEYRQKLLACNFNYRCAFDPLKMTVFGFPIQIVYQNDKHPHPDYLVINLDPPVIADLEFHRG